MTQQAQLPAQCGEPDVDQKLENANRLLRQAGDLLSLGDQRERNVKFRIIRHLKDCRRT